MINMPNNLSGNINYSYYFSLVLREMFSNVELRNLRLYAYPPDNDRDKDEFPTVTLLGDGRDQEIQFHNAFLMKEANAKTFPSFVYKTPFYSNKIKKDDCVRTQLWMTREQFVVWSS